MGQCDVIVWMRIVQFFKSVSCESCRRAIPFKPNWSTSHLLQQSPLEGEPPASNHIRMCNCWEIMLCQNWQDVHPIFISRCFLENALQMSLVIVLNRVAGSLCQEAWFSGRRRVGAHSWSDRIPTRRSIHNYNPHAKGRDSGLTLHKTVAKSCSTDLSQLPIHAPSYLLCQDSIAAEQR